MNVDDKVRMVLRGAGFSEEEIRAHFARPEYDCRAHVEAYYAAKDAEFAAWQRSKPNPMVRRNRARARSGWNKS